LLDGVDCSPSDVLKLLKRVVELPGFVGFSYRDERGSDARPARPEMSATTCRSTWTPGRGGGVSICRCGSVTCTATSPTGMCGCATPYAGVLGDDVRTPEQFVRWLAANGFPTPDETAVGTNAKLCCSRRTSGVEQASHAAR